MRKNKFFDTIMIALILMIGFRIIFPGAFSGAAGDSPVADPHSVSLVSYETIDSALAYYNSLDGAHCESESGTYNKGLSEGTDVLGAFFSPLSSVRYKIESTSVASPPGPGLELFALDDNASLYAVDSSEWLSSTGTPAFFVGDTLWYIHSIYYCDYLINTYLGSCTLSFHPDDASVSYFPNYRI